MHFAWLCVGHAVPVAPVPLAHVHVFVEQTRFRVVVGETDSYSPAASEHEARHAGQEPLLKYRPELQDTHLGLPCVGHAVPVAAVPPEHVHVFNWQEPLERK